MDLIKRMRNMFERLKEGIHCCYIDIGASKLKTMAKVQENGIKVNGIHEELNGTVEVNGLSHDTPKKFEIPTAKLKEINVSDYMRDCLDKVALVEGFVNYEINVNHGSAIGDGFVGILFKATIQENEGDKKLSVILKCPPENLARRHEFNAMVMFEREVFMYSEVLPAFTEFHKEKKFKGEFINYPKCFFAEINEDKSEAIIIMEDLKENGYKMWDKFIPVNYEHTKLVLEALGRFHAVSFAMKAQKPELFEKFKLKDVIFEKISDQSFATMMTSSIDRAIATLDENDIKRRNRAESLKNDFENIMKNLVDDKDAEPYAIVTHGDCWSNNFMFQYKRGRPEKVVLLDWQISRYSSPVLDLVYFFFVCTDGPLRAKSYDELISIYHQSLKHSLDHLGGDTMSQFPFTALMRQLKKFGKFGVIMATMLVPMLSIKSDDLPDMDFMADNMKSDDPAVIEEMMKAFNKNSDNSIPRMRSLLSDAIRYGYV